MVRSGRVNRFRFNQTHLSVLEWLEEREIKLKTVGKKHVFTHNKTSFSFALFVFFFLIGQDWLPSSSLFLGLVFFSWARHSVSALWIKNHIWKTTAFFKIFINLKARKVKIESCIFICCLAVYLLLTNVSHMRYITYTHTHKKKKERAKSEWTSRGGSHLTSWAHWVPFSIPVHPSYHSLYKS